MTTQPKTYCVSCGFDQATAEAHCTNNIGRSDSRHVWSTLAASTKAQPLGTPTTDTQPDPYYEAVRELRDRLAWHQDTLDTLRRSIEEHAARAVELEDQCAPVEQTIASIQALIGVAGGAGMTTGPAATERPPKQAWVAYDKAWAAYLEAQAAYASAQLVYSQALDQFRKAGGAA